MEIARLKEFIDLANTLSFTKTACDLNVSQSALSRHIADLEREVGTELLKRTTTSVSLTPAGRAFYERASVMVREYDSLLDVSASTKRSQLSALRVSGNTMQPFTNRILFQLAFNAAYRNLPIRFDYHKTRALTNEPPVQPSLEMLGSGELDLSIEVMPFDARPPRGFEGIHICCEPLIAIASARNPLSRRKDLKMDDLRGCVPVTTAVYKGCADMELAPFLAAGLDVSRSRLVFIQNMLEIPELIASLNDGEVAPLEQGFCSMYGFDRKDNDAFRPLDMDDDRMRFSYWCLSRKDDRRADVLQATDLLKEMLDGYRSRFPEEVYPDGSLKISALIGQ